MKKNKKFFLFILITVIIFTFLIPLKIYNYSPYLISILGAILAGISIHKILFSKTESEKPGCLYVIAPFLSICLVFLFVFTFSFRKEKTLASRGVITEGKIIDRLSLKSRKGEVNDLIIEFTDLNNKTVQFSDGIPSDIFTSFKKNNKLTIIYDPENPVIAKSLYSNEIVENYTNLNNELLTIKNLISFNKEPQVIKTKIKNFGVWTNQSLLGGNEIWINIPNKETLIINDKQTIYKTNSNSLYAIENGIENNNFKEIKKIENLEIKDIIENTKPSKGKNYFYQNGNQILILNEEIEQISILTAISSIPKTTYTIKILNKTQKSL